ncbi:S41 family peptidase [Pendulispora brunnea]|uniref:S41 family peptidase n=1 Tax=Pendulispora brunnea TaxID=2905690 RepID=A0ABZ2KA94_9BACT
MLGGSRRRIGVGLFLAVAAGAIWLGARHPVPAPVNVGVVTFGGPAEVADAGPGAQSPSGLFEQDEGQATSFRVPSGAPSELSCEEARSVVSQVREMLAYRPAPIRAAAFADAVIDWLDPHGLWSAAPDSPVATAIERHGRELLRELEHEHGDCAAAREVGRGLERWVHDLQSEFEAKRQAMTGAEMSIDTAVFEPIADGASPSPKASTFAVLLGERVGAGERLLGTSGATFARAAREHFFPDLNADAWSRVLLAAGVRAYVPLVDPHGGWAPLEEEASIYEFDLDSHPRASLWEKIGRTALGARIESGALPPMRDGDAVLALGGVRTAGLAMEQLQQLAIVVAASHRPTEAIVLRQGDATPQALKLDPEASTETGGGEEMHVGLPAERIPYGDGSIVVVTIREVRDDLGEQLAHTIVRERAQSSPPVGIVLDLRGNGGGSTDGAIHALSAFLPNAPLFPMKRQDGSLEMERAPEPPPSERFEGPVATFVDGNTASAAEMISGALTAYRRGPSVGRPTYGKGCAQEYSDDDARAGVLRLTTLLYALPDGSAVQRVGLTPTLRFPFALLPDEDPSGESEAKLAGSPPTWRGPDVRNRQMVARFEAAKLMTWPSHGGHVGPCKDPDVCRALHVLGGGPPRISAASKPAAR